MDTKPQLSTIETVQYWRILINSITALTLLTCVRKGAMVYIILLQRSPKYARHLVEQA